MSTPAKKPAPKPAARKPRLVSAPAPATAPVIEADVAFGNIITAARDASVVQLQALQNDRLTRDEYYDREVQRLAAARNAEIASIDAQIAQQTNIQTSCDAALETLRGKTSNVVPLKADAA